MNHFQVSLNRIGSIRFLVIERNMKKILSKFEKNERVDISNSGSTQREASCFIGKVFTVGRTVVTVEDILAEG